ncbi:MAG: transposase family protein [Propionibacteriaceae bacterium]|nr:transposase family protein [Propionibacteriaceae bacterium]
MHSSYSRRIADLSITSRVVTLHLRVRRFRCPASGCPQRIFAEQMPGLAGSRARRSVAFRSALQEVLNVNYSCRRPRALNATRRSLAISWSASRDHAGWQPYTAPVD